MFRSPKPALPTCSRSRRCQPPMRHLHRRGGRRRSSGDRVGRCGGPWGRGVLTQSTGYCRASSSSLPLGDVDVPSPQRFARPSDLRRQRTEAFGTIHHRSCPTRQREAHGDATQGAIYPPNKHDSGAPRLFICSSDARAVFGGGDGASLASDAERPTTCSVPLPVASLRSSRLFSRSR